MDQAVPPGQSLSPGRSGLRRLDHRKLPLPVRPLLPIEEPKRKTPPNNVTPQPAPGRTMPGRKGTFLRETPRGEPRGASPRRYLRRCPKGARGDSDSGDESAGTCLGVATRSAEERKRSAFCGTLNASAGR